MSRNLHDSCDIYRLNNLVWNSEWKIVCDFGFVTYPTFFGCEPVRSWWGYLTTWEIIWNIFFESFLLWEIVKEHYRFVASICDLMRCIARDNNKGGIIVSIDFDGLVTNLDNRCASENSYLGVLSRNTMTVSPWRSPEDNIVLCFFMPMKWQKTAFVHSNKPLFEHTGKFSIFNLKVKIK